MARVKIEVDDEVVDAVFDEKDDFRLSVRGMTLMEAVLEGATKAAVSRSVAGNGTNRRRRMG
jgi:hypothetical protein